MKEIQLTQEQIALVDDEDFSRVNQYKWQATWAPTTESFYARRNFYTDTGRTTIPMARFIINCPRDLQVDHRDHDTLNNQKFNLRTCTAIQNGQNRKPNKEGTSKYKGVTWEAGMWRARIRLRNIFNESYKECLGRFKTEEEAAKAYDTAAQYYFEGFAYLNFPGRRTKGRDRKYLVQIYGD